MSNPAPLRWLSLARVFAGRRPAGSVAIAALLALTTGCRTPGPDGGEAAAGDSAAWAYVIRVNAAQEFVILDCLVLPRTGEELAVWRGERRVALVRAGERRRGSLVAADVLAGAPRRGDIARGEPAAHRETMESEP